MEWIKANSRKPDQGERVILKIKHEDCPVVGYWGCGEWEVCTVNLDVIYGDAEIIKNFKSEDVTHYAYITNIPN